MKINPIFMPYCENCDRADLSLVEPQSAGLYTWERSRTWHVNCSHEDACRRIARLVEKEKETDSE